MKIENWQRWTNPKYSLPIHNHYGHTYAITVRNHSVSIAIWQNTFALILGRSHLNVTPVMLHLLIQATWHVMFELTQGKNLIFVPIALNHSEPLPTWKFTSKWFTLNTEHFIIEFHKYSFRVNILVVILVSLKSILEVMVHSWSSKYKYLSGS